MGINGLFLEYWHGKCLAKMFMKNIGTGVTCDTCVGLLHWCYVHRSQVHL